MPDTAPDKRLDGWKAIANYFRRDRTTVMRWARERNLPVHRLPGGVQGSVFALESELAAWAVAFNDLHSDEPHSHEAERDGNRLPAPATPDASSPEQIRRGGRRWAWLALIPIAVAAAFLIAQPAAVPDRDAQPIVRATMPDDPAAASDYAAARDLWAQRTGDSLRQSIALYGRVIARAPDFAPAYAGLAEAWLIFREYGDAPEGEAYRHAQNAVDRAILLDPGLASAHRARGFIQYWWHYDAQGAQRSFARALAIDPNDGLTHFWHANILADRGDDAGARRAYDQARVLLPGTPAIEVERACAEWQAGRDAHAIAALTALKARYPSDATIPNCLAWAHISGGDIAGYAREYRIAATLRGEPQMVALVDALDAAIVRDPASAHRVLIADARREFATGARQTRISPAFFASSMGDRESLVLLMREAANLEERWYSMTLIRRIGAKWRDDREIQALLRRLRRETPGEA